MTSPNRQLTTELNFKYNPANLNKFINGVRTFNLNSLAAAGAIGALGAAVYETVNRVIDIGNNTIKIKDIAEAAGFAASEFSQFRDAAAKAGISTENFDSDFKKLSATIQQARIGTGELFRIFRESGGKIRLPDNLLTDAENFKLIFKDIFDYINSIPSETRKIQVLSNIFSPESAVRWRDAIAEGFDSFQKAAEATKQQNADLDAQTEKFKELSKAIGEFSSVAAANFRNFAAKLAPVVTAGVNVATEFIRPPETRPLSESLPDFFSYLFRDRNFDNNEGALITTNIEINVPPGTTEDQSVYMSDMVKTAVSEAIDEQTRIVISNNPQME